VALVLAGNLATFGSYTPWDTCPDSACHREEMALMVLSPTSGVEFGPGIVTVLLGIVLVVAGLGSLRSPVSARPVGGMTGVLVVLTTVAFFLRMHVFTDELYYGPEIGLIVVASAGLIAILASLRLPRATTLEPRSVVPPDNGSTEHDSP
jgi:hypothetical protein